VPENRRERVATDARAGAEPASRWRVKLEREKGGLGLVINTKRHRYDYVVVREVVPNQQFDRFNAENPSESCEVGDRIVQVNGVSGAKPILAELKSAASLRIDFARLGDDPDLSSDEHEPFAYRADASRTAPRELSSAAA
jgi:hypothetical protein